MREKPIRVRRYITAFDKISEKYIGEFPLKKEVPLEYLQSIFEIDSKNPMYDCYEINKNHIVFLKKYLTEDITFELEKYSYYVEAESEDI